MNDTGVAWDVFMNDIRSRYMTFIIVTFMNDTDFMDNIRSRYMTFMIVTFIFK